MFDTSLFKESLSTVWLGKRLKVFDEIESTNTYAKTIKDDKLLHGTLILAENQTGGRGQHKRKWEADAEKNLTFTLILIPFRADRLPLLTLSCALAVKKALEQYTGLAGELKWPNDILIGGKKVCGVLTETQFIGNTLEKVIVGIGLNVNQEVFSSEISETATSLKILLGENVQRELLLAEIALHLEVCYQDWHAQKPELIECINTAMVGYGKWVNILVNGELQQEEYKFLGIDDTSALRVLSSNMEIKRFEFEQIRIVS